MSEGRKTADLRALDERYEVRGELRGAGAVRTYIGRMKDSSAEVAIMVTQAPGDNNELSHLASDARMLTSLSHPGLIRVLDGCWLGTTGFAVVSERLRGESLAERLERGERFASPRIAAILQDVKAVLDWAREKGIVHRNVTPDTLIFEQGSDRVRVSLAPWPIAMSGVPDIAGDARTIGKLAWAMYTGQPYGEGEHIESLGTLCPNLATRAVDGVNKMVSAEDHADTPDIATFIATVAAADVLKQAEVEIAAMKEEYDEQHAAALHACEVQRQETEQHAAEQVALLAGEREEFERSISDERAAIEAERTQMATERAEFERLMKERKDKLAAVRAELDQERASLEKRLSELEAYRTEVERIRKEALAASAAATAAQAAAAKEAAAARDSAAREAAKQAAKQGAAREASAKQAGVKEAVVKQPVARQPIAKQKETKPAVAPEPVPLVTVPEVPPPPPHLKKKQKTDWDKFDAIDQDESDLVPATGDGGRPRWLVPAGVATLLIIVVAAVYGLMHRLPSPANAIKLGQSTVVPTAPAVTTSPIVTPRGGFLTQSAGGTVSPRLNAQQFTVADSSAHAGAGGVVDSAQGPATSAAANTSNNSNASDQAAAARRAAARDSAARVAAARDAAAREAARRQREAEQDYTNPTPRVVPQPRPDTNTQPASPQPRPDTVVYRPPTPAPQPQEVPRDTGARPRPDTTRVRPDTTRPRPDTTSRAPR
jgi:hypothetical protein